MKRNGFTLIELLAVIVILAIIAVIAVPIVINIIDESKENATLRSAEMYMDAVELSIADRVMHHGAIQNKAYPIMSNGNICLENYQKTEESETCNGLTVDVKNNEKVLEVEVKGSKPTSGTIIIENGEIVNKLSTNENEKTQLVIDGKPIIKNDENEFEISTDDNTSNLVAISDVCDPVVSSTLGNIPKGNYEYGDEYVCDLGDGDRHFFVLENGNNTTIENSTIFENQVAFIMNESFKESDGSDKKITWCLKGNNVSCDGDGVKALLEEQTTNWNVSAVLPTIEQIAQVADITVDTSSDIISKIWLYNTIEESPNPESVVYGYWTSTIDETLFPNYVWRVNSNGYLRPSEVGTDGINGVRPVIVLEM